MQNYLLDAGRRVNGSGLDPHPNPFNLSNGYRVIGFKGLMGRVVIGYWVLITPKAYWVHTHLWV